MGKKILIGCAIALGVAFIGFVVIGFIVWHYVAPVIKSTMKMPPALNKAGVLNGTGFLVKSHYLVHPSLGQVTDIKVGGPFNKGAVPQVGVAGENGVCFLGVNGNVLTTLTFPTRVSDVKIVDVEHDGVCEYLDCGTWSNSAALYDHKGSKLWSYGGFSGVDGTGYGDINGDGRLEFVVGFNGNGGIHLVDSHGKRIWQQPDGNVWHSEIVDINGKLQIVHSNAGSEIKVRDAGGNVVSSTHTTPIYFSHFSICRWPSSTGKPYALQSGKDLIAVMDFNGKSIAQLNAPSCPMLGNANGVHVKLKSNQPEYFAAVVSLQQWRRSILYVYDSGNKLVYQEVMTDVCPAIAAVPDPKTKAQALLIGVNGAVEKYTIATP